MQSYVVVEVIHGYEETWTEFVQMFDTLDQAHDFIEMMEYIRPSRWYKVEVVDFSPKFP